MDLTERFRADSSWPSLRNGAVLAVSGGVDSAVLLDLAIASGIPASCLTVAHLDHGLREDSRLECRIVGERAREAGVAFAMERVDVAARARRDGSGLEGAGRRLRYEFFARVAAEVGAKRVATAHHLDDLAETVVLQLIRGCGPAGLRGILPSRRIGVGSDIGVVRPLLRMRRSEIVEHATRRGLSFMEDPTNLDGSNLRSIVRTRLFPELRGVITDLEERLCGLAERARELVPARADD
jgi:tRNA(Ile)-lysidine synthase